MLPPTPFLAAKCYWPGVTERAVALAAGRGAAEAEAVSREGSAVGYLGSILFRDDELVLCLFVAPSSAAVRRVAERAGIPCERVMNSQWIPHSGRQSNPFTAAGALHKPPTAPHKEANP
jgi:hypothetical protein